MEGRFVTKGFNFHGVICNDFNSQFKAILALSPI